MRVPFHPLSVQDWDQHICGAKCQQYGAGVSGFSGMPYQRGAGLGSFFMGLFRRAIPLLKSAAKAAGKQALSTAATVVGDVARGQDVGESVKSRSREGVAELADKASNYFKGPGGSSNQEGSGIGTRQMYALGSKIQAIKKRTRKKAIKEFPIIRSK